MIDAATAMHTSHCPEVELTVWSSRWNGPNSVASTIAATDMPLMSTNRRSSNVLEGEHRRMSLRR